MFAAFGTDCCGAALVARSLRGLGVRAVTSAGKPEYRRGSSPPTQPVVGRSRPPREVLLFFFVVAVPRRYDWCPAFASFRFDSIRFRCLRARLSRRGCDAADWFPSVSVRCVFLVADGNEVDLLLFIFPKKRDNTQQVLVPAFRSFRECFKCVSQQGRQVPLQYSFLALPR